MTNGDGIDGKASSRSLKIFFLVDCSYSMTSNEKIQKVNHGIRNVLPVLEEVGDDFRLDVSVGVIAFGESAHWHVGPDLVPVTDLIDQYTNLNADKGSTSTSQAINLLTEALDVSKMGRRAVPPVAILLSDGYSTDAVGEYDSAIDKLNSISWGKKCVRLSIGIGADGQGDYNKDELDSFISPYLREEDSAIQTLEAKDVGKIALFIQKASVVAAQKSGQSDANIKLIEGPKQEKPVNLTPDDLAIDDDETPDISDPSEVF